MWPLAKKRSTRPSRSASKKAAPHAHSHERRRRQTHVARHVLELPAVAIPVERVHVLREVRDDEVEPAVAVVVSRIDAHAGLRAALAVERDAALEADALEGAVAAVPVEKVRTGVVGHVEIDPPVVVVVGRDDTEAVAPGGIGETVCRRGLDEPSVAGILEEQIAFAGQALRADHRLWTTAPAERALCLLELASSSWTRSGRRRGRDHRRRRRRKTCSRCSS